ncbi:hypothetical protein CEE37_05725 [candidate division LCP-89 bacterium B3_LCP]|uniref:N-acetylmuramoyl-L-alanine amidase n=1 Tax=candidate division LCP-89 bacterium B3_LCP TaxID=2012998 RepID=A0A532V1U0_UNCL8|nr:MAG: hypothetical protein CEE37_05725 [candidate division LCP-89 bacterium B3_LCP]
MDGRINGMMCRQIERAFKVITIFLTIAVFASTARGDLSGWRIGIDPGHGGTDPGAVGPTGLQEKEVNLTASLGMRYFLVRQNAEVFMTRTTDVTLSLSSRANFMNSNDVDRSICVHHNSSSNPDPNWHLTYVAEGTGWATSGDLAFDISHRVTDFNGLGFGWSNCGREGVYEENFYMLIYTYMPSVLPEISFISNPLEEQRLYHDRYCYGNGRGMYEGIMDHLGGWGGDAGEVEGHALEIAQLPTEFKLHQSYPNPFNAQTVIPLELPQRSMVKIELFNVSGRNLGTICEGIKEAGWPKVHYNAAHLASGLYFYKVVVEGLEQGGSFMDTGKMLLLK